MDRYTRIGALIKKARLKAGLTMDGIRKGDRRGIGKGYLSGIENGKVAPPSFKAATKLAFDLDLGTFAVEFAVLCQLLKLPQEALDRPLVKEDIENIFEALEAKAR